MGRKDLLWTSLVIEELGETRNEVEHFDSPLCSGLVPQLTPPAAFAC